MLKLSLIIPVYNEEHHIKACLDAIAYQSVMPAEVIVVDNNCTDNTIKIANKYKFVRVVNEARQGRAYARSAGFNSANCEILGRIDADSVVSQNWVERVLGNFESDTELMGITGLGKTAFIPGINRIKSKLMSRSYYWFVHAGFNTVTMWGANMAIRKVAWTEVRNKVSLDNQEIHEDQDVSLWLAVSGGRIVQDNGMIISTDGQTYRYLPKLAGYTKMFYNTRKIHRDNGNLKSKELRRIGVIRTLPGRVLTLIMALCVFIIAVVFFPIDFAIKRIFPNSKWLS